MFTVDHEWRITSFNRAAEEITGVPREEAIGRYCWEVFRANMCEGDCALRRSMQEGRSYVSSSTYIINSERRRIPISVSTAPLRNEAGEILGGVETFRDNTVVDELRRELSGSQRQGDMVSASHLMRRLFAILPQIAESDATVLVEGETGTGKELLARTLHDLSPRRDRPFVAINCGALPDTLLESELFGVKAGAYTGATRDRLGRFAQARGGTIFLDEIGEISPALQVRLLRVLQERTFEPLGSSGTESTDARVIVATNRNLADLIREGLFREDLYYRINVFPIFIPPLRERREDILPLAEYFIRRLNRVQGRSVTGIGTEALFLPAAYDWPGNIRELENCIERAFVLCGEGRIDIDHLAGGIDPSRPRRQCVEGRTMHDMLDRRPSMPPWSAIASTDCCCARAWNPQDHALRRMKRLWHGPPARARRPAWSRKRVASGLLVCLLVVRRCTSVS